MSIESDMIHVEVVYALPQEQRVFNLVVNNHATVEEIIRQSGVLELYPEIDLKKNNSRIISWILFLKFSVIFISVLISEAIFS